MNDIGILRPSLPILIVEDERPNQVLIQKLLERMGIPSLAAENGRLALDLRMKSPFSVYLVDLMMPVMTGQEFIIELKKIEPEAIILVQTTVDSPAMIIDIMKLGVFDYIIKPISVDLFAKTLRKTLEFRSLKEAEKERSRQAAFRLRSQLDWLNYKESHRLSGQDSQTKNLIYNLKTSLSQGAGFGAMVTMLQILGNGLKKVEEGYIVNGEVMDLLMENNEICLSMLEGLESISDLLEKEMTLRPDSSISLVESLPDMVSRVLPFLEDKEIRVTWPDSVIDVPLLTDRAYLRDALEELFINACKNTPAGGRLDVYTGIHEGYFSIHLKNDIYTAPYGGIPADMEKMVLEPFIRLRSTEEDVLKIEKFSLGLGLTVVDHIIRKHGGLFILHDVKDYTSSPPRACVLVEIYLPQKMEGDNPVS